MKKKLTLNIDSAVLDAAKTYVKAHKISLPLLVENYLGNIVKPNSPDIISPRVKKLSGVVKLPKAFDEKKEYKKHLVSKYGKI
jgi:hypothetical protein